MARQPCMYHVLWILPSEQLSSFTPIYLRCGYCFVCTTVYLGGVWGWVFFPVASTTTPVSSQALTLSLPDCIVVGLLYALMSLSVLGVGGVGWIPLDSECTAVTVSQLSALYMTNTCAPLARLTDQYWVGDLTYTAPTLPLTSVC